MKIYKCLIDFLVKHYSGSIQWKIGKWYVSSVKPYLLFYILFYGLLKVIQSLTNDGITFIAWWDIVLLTLLIPQIVAGFSMWAVNEQKRLNKETELKNDDDLTQIN